MDTHGHAQIHEGEDQEHAGAGDEPVAVVAIGVFAGILVGVMVLWIYASTH